MSPAKNPPLPPAEEDKINYDMVAKEEEEESLPPRPPKSAGTFLVEH